MLEIKVLGWDQKCSFSMIGDLDQDSFGRFVTMGSERVYFPDDALVWVREIPAKVEAPVVSVPPAEETVEETAPQPKVSRTHEMAVLARKAREERKKAEAALAVKKKSAKKPRPSKSKKPQTPVTSESVPVEA
jgi:outer membrane biosynthesis protein TonB